MLRLCCRCGKVVILNVFKTGINTVSFLHVFNCVLGVFNRPLTTPTLGLGPSLRLRFTLENASLLCLFVSLHHPRLHFNKFSNGAPSFGPCHCWYISVPCPAYRVHVAGDLIKTISSVAGVLATSFARALLGLIR